MGSMMDLRAALCMDAMRNQETGHVIPSWIVWSPPRACDLKPYDSTDGVFASLRREFIAQDADALVTLAA